MTTKIPVTIHGNVSSDVETGVATNGQDWTRFSVAVNDRRFNDDTKLWEDGDAVFHRVVVFGKQAVHTAASIQKGSTVLVAGDMAFGTYVDGEGVKREGRQIVADHVASSHQFNAVHEDRTPKADGPAVQHSTSGPVATPASTSSATLAR